MRKITIGFQKLGTIWYHCLLLVTIGYHLGPFDTIHLVPFSIIESNLVPLGTIRYHWVPLVTIGYHWVASGTIGYHWVPLGTIGYHQVPKGTIQEHTADLIGSEDLTYLRTDGLSD